MIPRIRSGGFGLLACCLASAVSGCANFIETRAIETFAEALSNEDLDALKAHSSDRFQRKALRLAEALEDFHILHLPEGKVSIVRVEEKSPDQKDVTVEIGDAKRRVLYRLVRDAATGEWVVDDIYVKQRHKGLTVAKSVTEQMDLLLSVREFLDAWRHGSRDDVLATTTTELGRILGELPPWDLAETVEQVVGRTRPQRSRSPRAELDDDVAVVRLPRRTGELVLTMRKQTGEWKVDDLAIQSADPSEQIASLRRRTEALNAALRFLDAYHAADKGRLEPLCTRGFFRGSLAPADPRDVPLPEPHDPGIQRELHVRKGYAELVLRGPQEAVRIELVQLDDEKASAPFLVDEVTIYELETGQRKRLSALFTGRAVMRLFASALVDGDLGMVRQNATADFNRRVWKQADETFFSEPPLSDIRAPVTDVVTTVFRGPVTEITVTQGQRAMTYVLSESGGQLLVDDVLIPSSRHPSSLKGTLELLLPLRNFRAGLRSGDRRQVARSSSRDFVRLVWSQVETLPPSAYAAVAPLFEPLTRIERLPGRTVIHLGSDRRGAEVHLVEENDRYVVDDVLIIRGRDSSQRFPLRGTLRRELIFGSRATPEPSRSMPATRTSAATVPTAAAKPSAAYLLPPAEGAPRISEQLTWPTEKPTPVQLLDRASER